MQLVLKLCVFCDNFVQLVIIFVQLVPTFCALGGKILCHHDGGGGIGGWLVPKWRTECHLTCVSGNERDLKLGDTLPTSW